MLKVSWISFGSVTLKHSVLILNVLASFIVLLRIISRSPIVPKYAVLMYYLTRMELSRHPALAGGILDRILSSITLGPRSVFWRLSQQDFP